MAYYAFMDKVSNGTYIVTEVIGGRDENEIYGGISDWEKYYGEIRGQKCLRTSYNGNIRKNYAGPGFTYDEVRDAFIPPKCHNEAVLNEDTCTWTCTNTEHNRKGSN